MTTATKLSEPPFVQFSGISPGPELRALLSRPVQSLLFVGGPPKAMIDAARELAGRLVAPDEATFGRIVSGAHPDVQVFERTGQALSIDDVRDRIIPAALRTPLELSQSVLIVNEIHLLAPEARGALLKVVEEPAKSTVFILICDGVNDELVTIASRCVQVPFGGGTSALDLTDPDSNLRASLWAQIPDCLDGKGSTVSRIVDDLIASIDSAAEGVEVRQSAELTELAAREKQLGTRGSGRADLEKKHRRQIRRVRTYELRLGLGVLAAHYRDRALSDNETEAATALSNLEELHRVAEALRSNPNERLLLGSLLLSLHQAC